MMQDLSVPGRLLKYWSGPRCCRFCRWPRREHSADIRGESRLSEQRRPGPKATQPVGHEAEGASSRVARSFQSREGDAPHSLPAIRPFCFYARTAPLFQQSPGETFLDDIRFGVRQLVRKPGFAALAIISMALGIGANTSIFSLIDTAVLRPLTVKD